MMKGQSSIWLLICVNVTEPQAFAGSLQPSYIGSQLAQLSVVSKQGTGNMASMASKLPHSRADNSMLMSSGQDTNSGACVSFTENVWVTVSAEFSARLNTPYVA